MVPWGGATFLHVSTPYTPPDGGSAVLFPPISGVESYNVDSPDLSKAANALYFNDESRWPATSLGDDGGSNISLSTWLVDSPDGAALANWLAATHHPAWLPGVLAPAPATDAAGTIPYVNPANSSDPDAIYALNYLIDNL